MLELTKIGNEVYCGDKKLTIVAQATKGEGKEVVRIDGLEGSNGQKFVSLSRLKEGLNTIECKAREVSTTSSSGYAYTEEEAKRVKELEAELAEIKARAKARYVVKPKILNESEVLKMDEQTRDTYLQSLMAYVNAHKTNN